MGMKFALFKQGMCRNAERSDCIPTPERGNEGKHGLIHFIVKIAAASCIRVLVAMLIMMTARIAASCLTGMLNPDLIVI